MSNLISDLLKFRGRVVVYCGELLLVVLLLHSSALLAEARIKIGVLAPLTGPLAEYGVAAQNGIELARSQHPDKFKTIDFLYEDSQWDAKTAVAGFRKLTSESRVSLVFNWGNPTSEAVAPLAERGKIPLLALTLDPRIAVNRKYVIRVTNSADDFAKVMAAYLEKQGYRRIGIVIAENTYVEGLLNGLKRSLSDKVSVEVVDRYGIQDQDFRTTVVKLGEKKFDAIGVFLISGQVSTFYRQLSAQGIKTPTFGTDFFESTTEIKLSEGGMNGAVYPHLGITPKFDTDYKSRFGNDYQIAYAGNAYDMAMVIAKVFSESTGISSDEIVTKLNAVKDESGIGGTFSYMDTADDGPHFHYPVQMKRIEAGIIQVIK